MFILQSRKLNFVQLLTDVVLQETGIQEDYSDLHSSRFLLNMNVIYEK